MDVTAGIGRSSKTPRFRNGTAPAIPSSMTGTKEEALYTALRFGNLAIALALAAGVAFPVAVAPKSSPTAVTARP